MINMTNTGNNSERYGPCEICEKHVSEIWIGALYVPYPDGHYIPSDGIQIGHKECIEGYLKILEESENHG